MQSMTNNIYYLPGAKEKQVVTKLVKLWSMIHNDILRYTAYKNRQKQGTDLLIKKCKTRLLDRLERVAKMQGENWNTNEEWADILKRVVQEIYGNNPPQYTVEELIWSFYGDTSETKLHYIVAYMRIIAKVPPNQTSLPFIPVSNYDSKSW